MLNFAFVRGFPAILREFQGPIGQQIRKYRLFAIPSFRGASLLAEAATDLVRPYTDLYGRVPTPPDPQIGGQFPVERGQIIFINRTQVLFPQTRRGQLHLLHRRF